MRIATTLSSALLGAALLCSCGDNDVQHDDTPDAGPDAPLQPLAPGIAMLTDLERPVDLTSDGRTALLWKQSTGELFFYDVATGQLDLRTTLDTTELQNQQPHAVSDAGHIVAGYGVAPEAPGRWDATNDWVKVKNPIGACPIVPEMNWTATGAAFDVTPDGTSLVGLLWDGNCKSQAFLWKDTGGDGTMVPLQKVGRGTSPNERASVVSDDGKVVAGFAPVVVGDFEVDRSPAVWTDDGTGFLLDPAPTDAAPGEVKAITADGALVAGDWATSDPSWAAFGGSSGFTWTKDTGVVRFSSATPASDQLVVNAMSSDGTFVYGKLTHFLDITDFFSPFEYYAYVWSKEKGLRNLHEVAIAAGITFPANHFLTNVQAVSADGRVVLGTAEVPPADPNVGFATEKLFVLVLPEGAL